jgi:hypothetical protein
MEKLDEILRKHAVDGASTINKLLGVAFIVADKDSELSSNKYTTPPLTRSRAQRDTLPRLCR